MQYLLVGLSLVMFYLLLLALSEHIGFTLAWIVASLVGALMNGVYLQAVLQGWRSSVVFTLALLALDGVMWVLLRSEDSALLLGTSVLLLALGERDVPDATSGLVCVLACETDTNTDSAETVRTRGRCATRLEVNLAKSR